MAKINPDLIAKFIILKSTNKDCKMNATKRNPAVPPTTAASNTI